MKRIGFQNNILKIFIKIFFVFVLAVNYTSASESSGTILSTTYTTALVCQDSACTSVMGHRINLKPTVGPSNPAISIADGTGIDGYAWGEKLGWVNFSAGNAATTTPGVQLNTTTGALYGYAWSQNSGWINFAPTNYGVTINSNGEFAGYAWASGQYGGWIKFDCSLSATTTCVKTDWRPVPARAVVTPPSGGGGGGGGGGGFVIPTGTTTSSTTPAISDPSKYKNQEGVQNQKVDFTNEFRADINDSGLVDIFDYNLVMVAWGKTSNLDIKKSKTERCSSTLVADVNCDGGVDALDFNLVMVYWGEYVGTQGVELKAKTNKFLNNLIR